MIEMENLKFEGTEGEGSSNERIELAYREQGSRMWRTLFALSGSRDIASDAVSEAFSQALTRGESLRDPTAWIWKVAYVVARGELARRSKSVSLDVFTESETPIEGGAEAAMDVFRAIATLPIQQRSVVLLCDFADRPPNEAARIIGTSTATVYVHLGRARLKLRQLLEGLDD
jgi:RNA polymerase sigma factor (sigma-70 family)